MTGEKRIRILYIDDDVALARLLTRAIERAGYEVHHAPDGRKGLALFHDNQYDVLLVDHMMPGYSGLEVIRAVVSRGELPPTIMITGAGDESVAVQAMKLGASDYVIKDFDSAFIEFIPTVIERALAKKQLLDDKRRAEAALRDSEARYRRLFENAPVGIFLFDKSGRITQANPACLGVFGYESREWGAEANVFSTKEIAERGWTSDCRECLDSGIALHVERAGTLENGEKICDRVHLVPIRDDSGAVIGGQGIVEDMSERHKAAELLLQMERLKAVGDLAGGVAHNFNNLLQVIIAGVEMAVADLEAGNFSHIRATLDQVFRSSYAGAEMVKRLGSFARMQPGLSPVRNKTCDLSAVVRQVLEVHAHWWKVLPQDPGTSIEISSCLAPECPVRGDANEWFEVAASLMKNAVEALPRGGRICVSTSIEQGEARLVVGDDGAGIAPQDIGRVFEPFFTTKGFQRSGMGLACSYGIATRHGGTINVESRPGERTTFTVRAPVAVKAPELLDITGGALQDVNLSVLLIDDVEPLVEALKLGLARNGHTVLTALSGDDGLQAFQDNQIDVVVCDLGMPGLTGWDVGRRVAEICRDLGRPKTPFILLTGWDDQADELERVAASHIDRVVQKPVELKNLLQAIRTVAQSKQ